MRRANTIFHPVLFTWKEVIGGLETTELILLLVNFKLSFALLLLSKGFFKKIYLRQIKDKFSSMF